MTPEQEKEIRDWVEDGCKEAWLMREDGVLTRPVAAVYIEALFDEISKRDARIKELEAELANMKALLSSAPLGGKEEE